MISVAWLVDGLREYLASMTVT